jgi:hypothetical protein
VKIASDMTKLVGGTPLVRLNPVRLHQPPGYVGFISLLAGCGERAQVVVFKQGVYQGKPDTPPYQNPPFNGDRAAWERTLATRAQLQNEYKRTHRNGNG